MIEWNVSGSHQPFLDMTVYRDHLGSLQHMPYRKARSHEERIPWISHHPLDVKRGTFIGEMSRLATLCSLHTHYIDAIKALVALYCKRGYPYDLVQKWVKNNMTERWQKRLNEVHRAEEPVEVLVLKSTFNTAWNYFSAKELGDTILGYWHEWILRAESGRYNVLYPKFSAEAGELAGLPFDLGVEVDTTNGPALVPDIRKINILNRRMIVSRKRTRNLFDLTSLWKKIVLSTQDRDASQPLRYIATRDTDSEPDSDNDAEDLDYLYQNIGYR